ncbi:MAG: hypothetical protein J5I47_07935 [Vicingus serpentipes]|nr:hypothetical protein [Vicingus serpentipes]
MDINKYSEIIEKTAVYPRIVDNFGIAYCLLGLSGELFEAEEAWYDWEFGDGSEEKVLKELGDICWYTTALCKILDIDVESVLKGELEYEGSGQPGNIFEMVKKFYRDGKEIDTQIVGYILSDMMVSNVLFRLATLRDDDPMKAGTYTLASVLKMNHDKLMRRRKENTLHGDGSER